MNIQKNISLKNYNTFHIDEEAYEMIEINTENELLESLSFAKKEKRDVSILGGGSNVLLTKPVENLLLKNNLKSIKIISENEDGIQIKFASGELWHQCVLFCVKNGYAGIENLSLIPGTIGAAPIQNIGAYGVELKDVFISLEAMDIFSFEKKIFYAADCGFGYRESVFKNEFKNKYFIISVTLKLQKKPIYKIEYGDIQNTLYEFFKNEINIKNISDAVIKIRNEKLPNTDEIGNGGSFFKNPIIEKSLAEKLKKEFETIPQFETENGVKIPAAWLIEQCGWKGYKQEDFGVHTKQALVLVNYDNAKGAQIFTLSANIITSVQQRFNITLEREVNVW